MTEAMKTIDFYQAFKQALEPFHTLVRIEIWKQLEENKDDLDKHCKQVIDSIIARIADSAIKEYVNQNLDDLIKEKIREYLKTEKIERLLNRQIKNSMRSSEVRYKMANVLDNVFDSLIFTFKED